MPEPERRCECHVVGFDETGRIIGLKIKKCQFCIDREAVGREAVKLLRDYAWHDLCCGSRIPSSDNPEGNCTCYVDKFIARAKAQGVEVDDD